MIIPYETEQRNFFEYRKKLLHNERENQKEREDIPLYCCNTLNHDKYQEYQTVIILL